MTQVGYRTISGEVPCLVQVCGDAWTLWDRARLRAAPRLSGRGYCWTMVAGSLDHPADRFWMTLGRGGVRALGRRAGRGLWRGVRRFRPGLLAASVGTTPVTTLWTMVRELQALGVLSRSIGAELGLTDWQMSDLYSRLVV